MCDKCKVIHEQITLKRQFFIVNYKLKWGVDCPDNFELQIILMIGFFLVNRIQTAGSV